MQRADGKVRKTVYVGGGVKSIEWVDPPVKGKAKTVDKPVEKKSEKK
jgi:hypothetical protein